MSDLDDTQTNPDIDDAFLEPSPENPTEKVTSQGNTQSQTLAATLNPLHLAPLPFALP